MKLLFLFMSQSSAQPGEVQEWEPKEPCGDFYNEHFRGECYFEMLKSVLDQGFIDDLKIIYESNRAPGYADWIPGVHCEVMPHISFAEKYIDDDTILFVRGGFKNWLDWLLKYKEKNWILLYAANTGRQRWQHWDVVLDDLSYEQCPYLDGFGRIFYHFIKPVNENFFFPQNFKQDESTSAIDLTKKAYCWDVCIGSSHIHDKKGQWRMVNVAEKYEFLFGHSLKMILPGTPKGGGIKTREMYNNPSFQIHTDMPGYVNRRELNDIFARSKIYVSLGAHGQNDRGPLEALAAGMPIVLGSPGYHSPWLRPMSETCNNLDNPYEIARILHRMLDIWTPDIKRRVRDYYDSVCSFSIAVNTFSKLIRLISNHKPTQKEKENVVELLRGVNCG